MNNNEQKHSKTIREQVLLAIESGQVKMRPKWHFAVKTALFLVGVVLAVFTLLYLTSFVIFILHQSGVWFMPAFGARGWREFLFSLPWLLVFLSAIFIILLQILIRRYSFAYGRPFMYSVGAILALAIAGGALLAQTSFHRRLFMRARDHHLPFAGGMYRQYGLRARGNAFAGVITEITAEGYKISNNRNELLNVLVSAKTRMPPNLNLAIGDSIVVLGKREGDSVRAFGIRVCCRMGF